MKRHTYRGHLMRISSALSLKLQLNQVLRHQWTCSPFISPKLVCNSDQCSSLRPCTTWLCGMFSNSINNNPTLSPAAKIHSQSVKSWRRATRTQTFRFQSQYLICTVLPPISSNLWRKCKQGSNLCYLNTMLSVTFWMLGKVWPEEPKYLDSAFLSCCE